ncbi:MAG TPA: FAD-dependent thymidylate synthase [Atribacterota bacterium]|nr:FAD-dependent thymidylate synthase [Atribacterota bacterium]
MKVRLINFSKNPEKTVAQSARLCYSSKSIQEIADSFDKAKQTELIEKIIKLGHYSVLEHICFTFGIENISRTCSHQLVRHRIASFSQRSQRYVKVGKEQQYIIPKKIQDDKNLVQKFKNLITKSHNLYQEMLEKEIPAEDARYILPQAISTSIIFTANARELIHFFRLRCCNRAQWEIRELAIEMLKLVKKEAPTIFKDAGPPCVIGPCPEGEMSCGHPWRKNNPINK